MKNIHHYLIFEQNDFFKNQIVEELLRERAGYYITKNRLSDFWILVNPSFLNNTTVLNSINKTNYFIKNENKNNFYIVLNSTDLEFIKWIKLRLGYFEELFTNSNEKKDLFSNGIYTNSEVLKNYKIKQFLNNNKYSLSPNILAEQFQSISLN
jgi:hypothetical protein